MTTCDVTELEDKKFVTFLLHIQTSVPDILMQFRCYVGEKTFVSPICEDLLARRD